MDKNCMHCGGTMENAYGVTKDEEYVCSNYLQGSINYIQGRIVTYPVQIEKRIPVRFDSPGALRMAPFACHVCGPLRKCKYCGGDLVNG
jgi:hypothetical protein